MTDGTQAVGGDQACAPRSARRAHAAAVDARLIDVLRAIGAGAAGAHAGPANAGGAVAPGLARRPERTSGAVHAATVGAGFRAILDVVGAGGAATGAPGAHLADAVAVDQAGAWHAAGAAGAATVDIGLAAILRPIAAASAAAQVGLTHAIQAVGVAATGGAVHAALRRGQGGADAATVDIGLVGILHGVRTGRCGTDAAATDVALTVTRQAAVAAVSASPAHRTTAVGGGLGAIDAAVGAVGRCTEAEGTSARGTVAIQGAGGAVAARGAGGAAAVGAALRAIEDAVGASRGLAGASTDAFGAIGVLATGGSRCRTWRRQARRNRWPSRCYFGPGRCRSRGVAGRCPRCTRGRWSRCPGAPPRQAGGPQRPAWHTRVLSAHRPLGCTLSHGRGAQAEPLHQAPDAQAKPPLPHAKATQAPPGDGAAGAQAVGLRCAAGGVCHDELAVVRSAGGARRAQAIGLLR